MANQNDDRNIGLHQGVGVRRILAVATAFILAVVGALTVGVAPASAITPPTPVTGLTVWEGGNAYPSATSVVLQWNRWEPEDPADPILRYGLTWSGGSQSCPSGADATVTCTITGLSAGSAYTFSIVPINDSGTGPSATALATVTPYGAPDAPSALSVTATTTTSATLGFTAPSGNGRAIDTYDVFASTDGGAYTQVLTTTSTTPTVGGIDTVNHNYSFRVRATNVGGPGTELQAPAKTGPFTASSGLTAGVPAAPTDVTADSIVASPSSATVTWTPSPDPSGHPVTGYTVTASPGGMTCADNTAAGTCTFVGANALTAGVTYTFTVVATNDIGTGAASLPSQGYLIGVVSGAPSLVTAVAGDGKATVSWEVPAVQGGTPIVGYKVELATDDAGPWTVVTLNTESIDPSYVVNGLTNGTTYFFRISAVNSSGPGATAVSADGALPGTTPIAPTDVRANSITASPSSATVTWAAPPDPGGYPVSGYTVTASPGGLTCVVPTATVSCTYTGSNALTPGVSYTFSVVAENGIGSGPSSAASLPYLIGVVPGAPTDVTAIAGDTTAAVSWTIPTAPGGTPIVGYQVERATDESGPFTVVTLNTGSANPTHLVTGLTNGTTYYFRVAAVNASGAGGTAVSDVGAMPGTTPVAPTNVRATSITASPSSVTVGWTAAPDPSGYPVSGYTVTASPGGLLCTVPTATVSCTFSGANALTPGISYTFSVVAQNAIGTGPASLTSLPYLVAETPGAPSDVAGVVGDKSVLVSWLPPSLPGGSAVTGYMVEVSTSSSGPFSVAALNTGTAEPSRLVTGLTNGTGYYFRVSAINASGNGVKVVSTSAAIPGVVPGAATNVRAADIGISPSTATVSWAASPSTAGHPVTGYVVTASPGGMTCVTVTTSCTFADDDALAEWVSYTFTVVATNDLGSGVNSIASLPYLIGETPEAVTDLSATASDGAASLSWTPPSGPVTGYQISKSTSGMGPFTAITLNTGSDNPNFEATGLTNGTGYYFQVVPINAGGTGTPEQTFTTTTPGAVPDAPQNVAVVSSTTTSVTLSWMAPLSDNGSAISEYTVSATPGTATCATSTLTCTVSGLTAGKAYSFGVVATNDWGDSVASPISGGTIPSAVGTVKSVVVGFGALKVSWSPNFAQGTQPNTYAVLYQGVEVCRTTLSTCKVRNVGALKPQFTVRAINTFGASAGSTSAPTLNPLVTARVTGSRNSNRVVSGATVVPRQRVSITWKLNAGGTVLVRAIQTISNATGSYAVRLPTEYWGLKSVKVVSGGYTAPVLTWR